MCDKAMLHKVLTTAKNGMKAIFGEHLTAIYLYGSYARNEADDESDIDLIVLLDMPKDEISKHRRTVSNFSSDIDLEYDVLVSIKLQDLQTFTKYKTTLPFFQNVLKEGVALV